MNQNPRSLFACPISTRSFAFPNVPISLNSFKLIMYVEAQNPGINIIKYNLCPAWLFFL